MQIHSQQTEFAQRSCSQVLWKEGTFYIRGQCYFPEEKYPELGKFSCCWRCPKLCDLQLGSPKFWQYVSYISLNCSKTFVSFLIFRFIYFCIFIWMFCLHEYIHIINFPGPWEHQNRGHIPWNWSYGWLWVTMWLLWTNLDLLWESQVLLIYKPLFQFPQ